MTPAPISIARNATGPKLMAWPTVCAASETASPNKATVQATRAPFGARRHLAKSRPVPAAAPRQPSAATRRDIDIVTMVPDAGP